MKVYIIEKTSPAGELLARTYYRTQEGAKRGLWQVLRMYADVDHLGIVALERGRYYVWNPLDLHGWYLALVEGEVPDDSIEARLWRERGKNG